MSKKQLNNRLENLFAGFEEKEPPLPVETLPFQSGWNWECDSAGRYASCGSEVKDVLGIEPQSFVGQSIYSYGLANGASKSLKNLLQEGVFPCETEIEFSTTSGEVVTVRLNVFTSLDGSGQMLGWHGFNQVIKRSRPAPAPKPVQKPIKPRENRLVALSEQETIPLKKAQARAEEEIYPILEPPKVKNPFSSAEALAGPLSIPVQIGSDKALLTISDSKKQRKWSEDERLLAEEVARQLALAMENARLYQEIRSALAALERRERYQSNIARAVALLSEKGVDAVPEVLESLGLATDTGRVVFMEKHEAEQTIWQPLAAWTNPRLALEVPPGSAEPIACAFQHWESELRAQGWAYNTLWNAPSPEKECLSAHNVSSALLLGITSTENRIAFVAFQDFGPGRSWEMDEINILKVAANALTNAFSRQQLLSQLQTSLEETENLYNASHHLAMANDLQEMVASITQGLPYQVFNRATLVLFDADSQGKLSRIRVEANWYSGKGTQPAPVGTEYAPSVYYRLFLNATPKFYPDIFASDVEPALRDIFSHQNARAAAVLPLWTSKHQTGVFLMLSDEKHDFSEQEIRSYPPLIDQLATAIENLHLFQQTQKALSETGLLYQISDGITQASDTPELVRLVAQHLLPKNAEAASIFLTEYGLDDKLIELELAGFTYSNGHYQPAGVHIPISALPFVNTLKNETLIISDVLHSNLDPVSQKSLRQLNISSGTIVPMSSAGRLVGILVASSRKQAEYAPEEVRLLQIAGGGIAVALEKQRLLRQAQRRALELQAAAEIARDTTSTLSLELLLNRIVTLLSEQFGYYHVAIYMVDDHGSYAVIKEATGGIGQALKSQEYRLGVGSRSVIGSVSASGKALIVNDVTQDAIYSPHPLLPETRAEMALPLKIGEKVIGILDLQSSKPGTFTPDESSVLQILSDQIAVAIENARAYEISQQALADIKEVDRLKNQFLANMSHELRTPLNSIIGFSRVILKGIDGPINDTQQQDLSAIYNSGQHLLSLITDILDLSKIEAGKMELQFSDVNLSDLINSVMSTAVGLVKDKPIKLHHIVPQDLPILRADTTRVRQVLINFISNAAKFTDQGSITVQACLTTSPTGQKEAMVTVTDTGLGIAAGDRNKLFQPFSQVDDSPTRKTGGTGLGLSISRSLIEMHSGRIGLLSSEIGKGSTFFFTLPLKKDEPAPVIEQVAKGNIILSIDDDMQVISLYERYLRPQGYQVIPLTNPNLAVETARELKPYAITLDVMMPDMDGWQVLQSLKNDPATRDIPVIMCTIMEEEEKGFNLGASEYLVKPFLQEDLTNTIARMNRDGLIHEVLVIDDDPADLRLVEKMLQVNPKFHVTLAEGGVKGWQSIQEKKPDAVILDLFMPEMDGFTVLANIRSDKALRSLPVIVLSGAALDAEQHSRLAQLGQQLLEKGMLRETDLMNTIENALRNIRR